MARTSSTYALAYVEMLNQKFEPIGGRVYGTVPGNRMDKITIESNGQAESVHCFIERATGHVYKAAGWTQPAKGVRFETIFDAIEKSDRHGAYLYK